MDQTTREIKALLRQAIPTPAAKRQEEPSRKLASFTDVMRLAHRINRQQGRITIGCNCQSCQTRKALKVA